VIIGDMDVRRRRRAADRDAPGRVHHQHGDAL
jgi:hypothetical protein